MPMPPRPEGVEMAAMVSIEVAGSAMCFKQCRSLASWGARKGFNVTGKRLI
jgi:hypothetical protein